jgi:hypothetical protein
LHLAVIENRLIDTIFGTELVLRADAGPKIFHLRLHKAALIPGGEMMYCGDPKEVALMDDDHARSKLRRLNHFLESFLQ